MCWSLCSSLGLLSIRARLQSSDSSAPPTLSFALYLDPSYSHCSGRLRPQLISRPADLSCINDARANCSVDPITGLVTASYSDCISDGSCTPSCYDYLDYFFVYTRTAVPANTCVLVKESGSDPYKGVYTEGSTVSCTAAAPAPNSSSGATRAAAVTMGISSALLLVLSAAVL